MKIPEWAQRCRGIAFLFSISLILTFVELYTTYILHGRGHIEWNPIMRPVLTDLGPTLFILINTVLSILLIAFLAYASEKTLEGRYRYLPLIVYCVIRGSTVVNNLLILADVL